MDGDGDDEGYRQNVKQMLKIPTSYHVALVVDESIWPNQSDVHFATDFSVDTLADSKVSHLAKYDIKNNIPFLSLGEKSFLGRQLADSRNDFLFHTVVDCRDGAIQLFCDILDHLVIQYAHAENLLILFIQVGDQVFNYAGECEVLK